MAVPSESLCDVLECDATWADSEPDLPLPMCPPSIWPTQMEWRRRFSRLKFKPSAESGGGWDSQRSCRRLRIVVGPEPRRQELLDHTDGGTEVCAVVGGDASGVPSPFFLWPTAVNAAGTEPMSLDSEGERLSDAHHDFEERDGASEVFVEHIEEEIPELPPLVNPARIRNLAAKMTSLDAVHISTVF